MTWCQSCLFLTTWETVIITLRVNDWRSESARNGIYNSCNVFDISMHFWAVSIVLFTPTIDGSTFLKSSSTCLLLLHLCRDRGKGVVGNCREACVGMKGAGIGRQAAVGQAVVAQALEAKGRDGVVGQGGGCRMVLVVGGDSVVEKWRCHRVCGVAVRGVGHTVVAVGCWVWVEYGQDKWYELNTRCWTTI